MNVFIKILPLLLCIIFLVGCEEVANHQTDLPPETTCPLTGTTPQPIENVEVKQAGTDIYYYVLSATNTQCTIKILTTSCSDMIFGEYFYLEKEVNGAFEKIGWKNEPFFIDLAYIIKSDEPFEKTYKWEYFLDPLENGTYRIVTDFYCDSEKITAYFQFEV